MELQCGVDAIQKCLDSMRLCSGWQDSTAQQFWINGKSIDDRLTETFEHILENFAKTDANHPLLDVIKFGNYLASPQFESSVLKQACALDNNLETLLLRFGSRRSGEGRRLRMELLSACWLISYFFGQRQDQFLEAVLRIIGVAQAIPMGLSYLVVVASIIDEERYQRSVGLSGDWLYIVRKKPSLLFGQSQNDHIKALENAESARLSQHIAIEGSLPAAVYLGYFAVHLQIVLLHRASKRRNGEIKVAVLYEECASEPQAVKKSVKKSVKKWGELGIKFFPVSAETLEYVGRGVFGTSLGVSYYGNENDAHEGVMLGPRYRGYLLGRENLYSKRDAAKEIVDTISASATTGGSSGVQPNSTSRNRGRSV